MNSRVLVLSHALGNIQTHVKGHSFNIIDLCSAVTDDAVGIPKEASLIYLPSDLIG